MNLRCLCYFCTVSVHDFEDLLKSYQSRVYMENVDFVENELCSKFSHGFYFKETFVEIRNSKFISNKLLEANCKTTSFKLHYNLHTIYNIILYNVN